MAYDTDDVALHAAYYWEKTTPDRIWLTQPAPGGRIEEYTWRSAMDEVRRMAAHLLSVDLSPGSHVALFSKNSAWWVMADLAIWMAGHVSVPVYPTLTPQTIRQILEHSEARLVFIGKLDDFASMEPGIPADLPRILTPCAPETHGDRWEDVVARTEPLLEDVRRGEDELGTIIYTSGTTGIPKGVMHSFGSMGVGARGAIGSVSVKSDDRMLSYLPLAHAFERWHVETVSLLAGFQMFFADSPDSFVQDLRRARPTLFISVPRLWQKFQAGVFKKTKPDRLARLLKVPIVGRIVRRKVLEGLGLDAVRVAGSGSAPIPGELIEWYRDLGLELIEGYGMTENFCYSHQSRQDEVRPGYVGRAYEDVECRISDEGEVLVKSPASMLGYYKMPEESVASFTEDGFLKTGDRGEIDERGRLRITGRVKELFKTSKGKYVAPAPIESKLLVHEVIEMVCVAGNGQPQPHAIVMLSDEARSRAEGSGREEVERALTEHLQRVNPELDHHEKLSFLSIVPDVWAVENGFLTPTLKLKRAVIDDTYGPSIASWYARKTRILWI